MSLVAIIQAIHGHTALANYQSPIRGAMAVQGALGASASVANNVPPPAIFWIPTHDNFSPARPSSMSSSLPRPVRTRTVGLDAHIHAERTPIGDFSDFATCEELLNRLCFAVHATLQGSYRFGAGHFLGQDASDLLQDRTVYVLSVEIDIPIYDPGTDSSTATIAHTPVSGGMTFPSGTSIGPSTPPP